MNRYKVMRLEPVILFNYKEDVDKQKQKENIRKI